MKESNWEDAPVELDHDEVSAWCYGWSNCNDHFRALVRELETKP